MGREIRKVPADWLHPRDALGHYIPLFDGFNKDRSEWDTEAAKWAEGLRRDHSGDDKWKPIEPEYAGTYEEWAGSRPEQVDYMPDWPEDQCTHICMYEDCSEGTPISPSFATPEECARWLADNGASAFGYMTATYEQWLATCRVGHAISAVCGGGKPLRSGVELNAELP